MDHVLDPEVEVIVGSRRIVDILNLFRSHLAGIGNPNMVWHGTARLQVVSVSLTQASTNSS
ncbi:hypothetical protein CRD59_01980 [Bifidobacterium xylocopae]|uniref:Uncharacterized protein n=2 Tax=Bifidobacterium xylocopae TaxID=2493119 RepID=A0A366KDP9_9BIFI|nr:hypothetical protein CRD59_01980 [Bifidobacterium xylocopae]